MAVATAVIALGCGRSNKAESDGAPDDGVAVYWTSETDAGVTKVAK